MSTILSLAPQNVWKHFYSLTQVPRPSGYLKKVQEFLLNFGKSVGVNSRRQTRIISFTASLPLRGWKTVRR